MDKYILKTPAYWKNGTPDRSRTVYINKNYTHTGASLRADKLQLKNKKILSVDNQLLVVTDSINIGNKAEIRLIGKSQLIQTHKDTAKVTGNGKIYIDRNSDIASVYRYNYMSSPVTTDLAADTYTVASVFKDGTTPLDATATVGQKQVILRKTYHLPVTMMVVLKMVAFYYPPVGYILMQVLQEACLIGFEREKMVQYQQLTVLYLKALEMLKTIPLPEARTTGN